MQRHKLSIVCCLILFLSTVASAKIVFQSTRDGNSEIYVMNDSGNKVHRLTNSPFYDSDPSWSPDGRKIAFARDLYSAGAGKGQQDDVFIMNASGSDQRKLIEHPKLDVKPAWSPDGHRLAFTSSRSGTWEIHVMDISSSNIEQLTDSAKLDGYASSPSWSPDGKQIAYELARRGQGRTIYIMDAAGKNAQPLIKKKPPPLLGNTILRFFPRWSPNGKQLLYNESEYDAGNGRFKLVSNKLVICHRNGFSLRKLPIPKNWVINSGCWAADGTEILFAAVENGFVKQGGNNEIYRYDRVSGEITNLTNHPSDDYAPDWSRHNLSVSSVEKLSILWGTIKREKSRE